MTPKNENQLLKNGLICVGFLILILIVMLLGKPTHGQTTAAPKTHNISAAWSFNYVPMPACGPHLGVNCVNGFQVGTWNGTACSDILRVANPASTTGTQNVHVNWKSTEPATAIFCVAATWFDFGGVFRVAAPAIEGTKTEAAGQITTFRVLRR